MSNKRLLLLLSKQGLLLCLVLRLLLSLMLRLEMRGHRDGCQWRTRTSWPHLDGARPGIVEAGPRAPFPSRLLLASSVLLLCGTTRRAIALS